MNNSLESIALVPPGGWVPARWWHALPRARVQCDLCPRYCVLRNGERGECYVRQADAGRMVLTSYGRAVGHGIAPVESTGLRHFYPGTGTLAFGTAGCSLGCRFCDRSELSTAREERVLAVHTTPQRIAAAAAEAGCSSIAFKHNEPVVFAELAIDCAKEAHQLGLKTVAVSSGYITEDARHDFFRHMDAVVIGLKSLSSQFYWQQCDAELEPVLETLDYLAKESGAWLEVTNLLIPGHNDSLNQVHELVRWHGDHLGPEVPLHFTAFEPAHRLGHMPPTAPETLERAKQQAIAAGLRHVYADSGKPHSPTRCTGCGAELVGWSGAWLTHWNLDSEGSCTTCRRPLEGRFSSRPGNWGGRRQPVDLNAEQLLHPCI